MRYSYLLVILLLSCDGNEKQTIYNTKNNNQNVFPTSKIENCIPKDTSVKNISIKYKKKDSMFQVLISIDKYNTILPSYYDCNIPFGLVPSLYSTSKNIVCLLRGYGQDYREFIICYVNGENIAVKRYETAMFTDLENERVVYQNYDKPNNVIVENILTGKRQDFIIDSSTTYSHFHNGRIEHNKLIVFYDNSKVVFSLSQK